jgi:CheY-like chemotaxis protein
MNLSLFIANQSKTSSSAQHPSRDAAKSGQQQAVFAIVDDDLQISKALGAWMHVLGLLATFHSTAESMLANVECDGQQLYMRQDISQTVRYPLHGAIIDINLPGMHGVTLARKLRQLQPDLIIVIVTSLREDERTRYGDLPPGVVCVRKPFDLENLEEVLFSQKPEHVESHCA